MTAKSEGKIFVATETGQASVEGYGEVLFTKGVTRVREGHPILKQLGRLFEPLVVQYDLEDATADPGTKRGEPRDEPEPEPVKKATATPQKK